MMTSQPTKPVNMVLYCPACGLQHIDAPEDSWQSAVQPDFPPPWSNPPHRSHLCAGCGHIWRPADVPTNGVAAITSRGVNDSAIVVPRGTGALDAARLDFLDKMNATLNARYGTKYGWRLILSPNIVRLMNDRPPVDSGHVAEIDLHDSAAHGLPSCRAAIDEVMSRIV